MLRNFESGGVNLAERKGAPEEQSTRFATVREASHGPVWAIPEGSICELIARWAERLPDALAVSSPEGQLTYAELMERARGVAGVLRRLKVGRNDLVAVLGTASDGLVVSELGIMLAGAAFLPMDPSYPPERAAFMLEDSGAKAVIVAPGVECSAPPGVPVLRMNDIAARNDLAAIPSDGADSAYAIYTSGSTGIPKAVLVSHENLMNLVFYYHHDLKISPEDRSTFVCGVAFDASIGDVWPYLTAGASVHIPPREARYDPRELMAWMKEEAVTICFVPTAMGEGMLDLDWRPVKSLRVLLLGGDRFPRPPKTAVHFRLINAYGPTEATVMTTWGEVVFDGTANPPPIGRPLGNIQTWVLDDHLQPVPPEIEGMLYAGGKCVAKGYVNRDDLNAARFIPNPFGPGRLYKTGDIVRWNRDWQLEFIGRLDNQLKINGFRVEPGEVEFQLRKDPRIRQAVVTARERPGGTRQLVAYVIPENEIPGLESELRHDLLAVLPPYMIPAHFVFVDDIPLTPNGKWDLKALPAPRYGQNASALAYENESERLIAGIWSSVLGLEHIRPGDDLFDLGADSIALMRIVNGLEMALGKRVTVIQLFRTPTIGQLATALQAEGGTPDLPECVVKMGGQGQGEPIFCIPGAGGGVHWFHDFVRLGDWQRPLYGLETAGLARRRAGFGVRETASRFVEAMRQVQRYGPYRICGYSLGGLIAYEMARQLREAGESVAWLGLLAIFGKVEYDSGAGKVWIFFRNFMRLPAGQKLKFMRAKLAWMSRDRGNQNGNGQGELKEFTAEKAEYIEAGMQYLRSEIAPYPGDATLIDVEESLFTAPRDPYAGWRNRVLGRLDSISIPGDHYNVLAPPFVSRLIDECQAALLAAEREM